ncbi:MAG: IS200/IS605 family transposase [bacterium]
MAYWRLYYHAIWSCHNREPLITPALEPELYKYLRGKGLELGGIMHAVGGIEDHMHSSFSLPPKYALADFIGKLKGASSHWVTHVLRHPGKFEWQRGYGVLSFGSRDLARVVNYVNNQKEHHQRQTTHAIVERCGEEEDGAVGYLDVPP